MKLCLVLLARIKMVVVLHRHLCHCRAPGRRGVETEGGILCRTRSRQVLKMILGEGALDVWMGTRHHGRVRRRVVCAGWLVLVRGLAEVG